MQKEAMQKEAPVPGFHEGSQSLEPNTGECVWQVDEARSELARKHVVNLELGGVGDWLRTFT